MTRRRWIADVWTLQGDRPATATLHGDQALHLSRVLRATPGEVFDVVANGFLHRAEVLSVSPEEVLFKMHEELEAETSHPLHLCIAIFKFDHFEWAIEKATELGVATVTPVVAKRTEKHLAQAAGKRVERWRRIAHEASKQSRRTNVPRVADPSSLDHTLAEEHAPNRLLLSETEQTVHLVDALRSGQPPPAPHSGGPTHALAVGPEGGWTPDEMALFARFGWSSVTLGPRILRAETAAIAAIAIVGSHLA